MEPCTVIESAAKQSLERHNTTKLRQIPWENGEICALLDFSRDTFSDESKQRRLGRGNETQQAKTAEQNHAVNDYVMEETLTSKLVRVPSEKDVSQELAQAALRLGEDEVTIALERVQIAKVMDHRPIEPLLPHRGSIRLPSFIWPEGWRITISPGWSPSMTSASKLLR